MCVYIYSYVYMRSLAYVIRLLYYMCHIFLVEPGRKRFAESASRWPSLLRIAGRENAACPPLQTVVVQSQSVLVSGSKGLSHGGGGNPTQGLLSLRHKGAFRWTRISKFTAALPSPWGPCGSSEFLRQRQKQGEQEAGEGRGKLNESEARWPAHEPSEGCVYAASTLKQG